MSALVKAAGQPLRVLRLGTMKLFIAASLVVSVAAFGFAVGQATSDRQASAVNGGSLAVRAIHPMHRHYEPIVTWSMSTSGPMSVSRSAGTTSR
jgi:hypothetical protein